MGGLYSAGISSIKLFNKKNTEKVSCFGRWRQLFHEVKYPQANKKAKGYF
jgi:hypothetical protein